MKNKRGKESKERLDLLIPQFFIIWFKNGCWMCITEIKI